MEPDDEDLLLPGEDPEHPCPKCGAVSIAPADGVKRLCGTCHWMWSLTDPDKGYYLKL